MRLVIGGAYQGKLHWLLQQTGYTSSDVAYTLADARQKPILTALHLEIRKLLEEGRAVSYTHLSRRVCGGRHASIRSFGHGTYPRRLPGDGDGVSAPFA